MSARLWLARALLCVLFSAAAPCLLAAQVPPAERWQTIRTEHFRVHFSPGLEDNARRAAVSAERAYAQLAAELVEPRGPIDLVVADNVDFTNGLATPFPSNRIIVYAHPPVSVASLRFYDDWNALVITHELAHIFHLDRTGGWWRAAQRVFGRAPILFPNAYAPAWLTEGLAIHYESRLTGTGRLVGTEHRALVRASAAENSLPGLNQLSLGSSHYPGGEGAYAYGALMVDYLARTRGPEGVRRLVDALGSQTLPFMLDRAARRSFGIGFSAAWREWRDSVAGEAGSMAVEPLAGWRDLTRDGFYALHPRWLGDSALVYAANTGRDVPGAYTVALDGRPRRVGRRNGLEPNVPLADGSLLFAQIEFDGPYRLRSDLYIQRGGREHRLTRNARLSHPDARADGAIVAVQAVPGTTRLVRVTADGKAIAGLTTPAADIQWAEPRWSPRGDRIAAVRHSPGAIAEIVVLDSLGQVVQVVAGGRAVYATPEWSADGERVLFVSDSSGRSQVYEVALRTGQEGEPRRLTTTATSVFGPALSPAGGVLALGLLRADGHHIGVGPYPQGADGPKAAEPAGRDLAATEGAPAPALASLPPAPARQYSSLATLRPYYWLPVVQQNALEQWQFGAVTSGQDVIGRHSYFIQAQSQADRGGVDAYATYRYLGLGQPALDFSVDHSFLTYPVAEFRVYSTVLTGAATVVAPGTRRAMWLQGGADIERFRLSRDTEFVPPDERRHFHDTWRSIFLSAGWSNTKRPSLSISPEDGVSASLTVRRQFADMDGLYLDTELSEQWNEFVGSTSLYRSLDLPGYAHHVLALRAAGGFADEQFLGDFAVGGLSGSALPLIGGRSIGGGRRTFPVRGFPSGAVRGVRAASGSLEYRAPAFGGGRGFRLLPVFFDRSSVTLFGDAGTAWCPEVLSESPDGVCGPGSTTRQWIASAGGEVNLDAAVLAYDAVYRIRLGLATPVHDPLGRATDAVTAYATMGLSF